jgi:hypothetical protein
MPTAGIAAMLCLILPSPPSFAAKVAAAVECPAVLATRVLAEKYRGWSIYSNDPLRLTGADVYYVADHEDATLDPDATEELGDENLSVVQIFRIREHPEAKSPWLDCHYGVHAQLSRRLPRGAMECKVVHHRRVGEQEIEFEASCR